ncbi:MAG: ABC transporter ATP-binding protein [Kiritimatiellae bacterium]|nr:ABC transporter ATP-binding protein [Kiritimatiellia bacterium]
MKEVLIQASDLAYTYPFQRERALNGVSFELRRGEAMLVTGPSGCGKSTLMRILNGLIPEHFRGTLEGSLEICGEKCPAPLERLSRRVGTVLQNPEEQIMATVVEEEVALALEWQSVPCAEMRERVDAALRVMDLSDLAGRSVFSLSSGERQKCVIASVVAASADIVVMDEPTANLSPEATEELAGIVARLKERGVAVVIVDHRLYWLRGVVDKVLVLNDGRAVAALEGLDCLERLGNLESLDSLGLRRIDVSRPDLRDAVALSGTVPTSVVLRDLSFRYTRRSRWIYRGISAALPRGKITAVVGANGAGKTTLARLLCGLLRPASGEIEIDSVLCPPRRRRDNVAFVMQQMDIQLYMRTVEEELLFSAPRSVPKAERRKDAERWLEVFGLSHLKDRHPHSLSGGEKQRLVVACALMKRPSLLILDEPTSGLDGRNMRIIARELREYASRGGTVLLITHDLELLSLAADCRLEIARTAEVQEGER